MSSCVVCVCCVCMYVLCPCRCALCVCVLRMGVCLCQCCGCASGRGSSTGRSQPHLDSSPSKCCCWVRFGGSQPDAHPAPRQTVPGFPWQTLECVPDPTNTENTADFRVASICCFSLRHIVYSLPTHLAQPHLHPGFLVPQEIRKTHVSFKA